MAFNVVSNVVNGVKVSLVVTLKVSADIGSASIKELKATIVNIFYGPCELIETGIHVPAPCNGAIQSST